MCDWLITIRNQPLMSVDCTRRMLRDAEHFKTRLSKLDGAGDIGNMIVGIVEGKSIERIDDTRADVEGRKPIGETVNDNEEKSSREEKVSPANDTASAAGGVGKDK